MVAHTQKYPKYLYTACAHWPPVMWEALCWLGLWGHKETASAIQEVKFNHIQGEKGRKTASGCWKGNQIENNDDNQNTAVGETRSWSRVKKIPKRRGCCKDLFPKLPTGWWQAAAEKATGRQGFIYPYLKCPDKSVNEWTNTIIN